MEYRFVEAENTWKEKKYSEEKSVYQVYIVK